MLTLNYLLADHLCRKTAHSERCRIPFKYKGIIHYSCTTTNSDYDSWCYTSGSWDWCDERCGGKMCTNDWNFVQQFHYRIQYWVWFNTIFIYHVVDITNDGLNTEMAGLVTVGSKGTVQLMVGGGVRDFGNRWYVRQGGEWKATLKSLHSRLGFK